MTYRFTGDNETAQTRSQYGYIVDRKLPSMQVVYGNSIDMPERIDDNQLLITKDEGCLYVWWNGRLKKLNFEKANFSGGASDSAAPDNIVVVYDDTELAGQEPRENTLYITRRTGTIKYYDGQQYEVLFSNENAHKVNGHTVESNVPKDAKFTDTTYEAVDEQGDGLMTPEMLARLNNTVSKEEFKEAVNNLESRDDFETGIASKADKDSVYTKEEVDKMQEESKEESCWKELVENKDSLPSENVKPGDIYLVRDENTIFCYQNEKDGWRNMIEKVELPGNATEKEAGFMSAEDKAFLDEIPSKYAMLSELENTRNAIPDVSGFVKKVEAEDLIKEAVAPLAQQSVVDSLTVTMRAVRESIPNAYTKSESDNRYLKATDKQDLSGYALKSDIQNLPHKEDLAEYVKQTELGKYASIELLDTFDNKYLKKNDADFYYAPKAPSGSSYAIKSDLEKFALASEVKQLREIVETLQKQLEAITGKEEQKGVVIGYAVTDDSGNAMGEFIGVKEFDAKKDFVYTTDFTKEETFRDGMCVRLFSNLQDLKTASGAVLHSETKMNTYADLQTSVAAPYYYLTKPMHVTEDFQLEVSNVKSVSE